MPIEFRCTQCGRILRTPDGSAGKKGRCPHCGAVMDIPAPVGERPMSPSQSPAHSSPTGPASSAATPPDEPPSAAGHQRPPQVPGAKHPAAPPRVPFSRPPPRVESAGDGPAQSNFEERSPMPPPAANPFADTPAEYGPAGNPYRPPLAGSHPGGSYASGRTPRGGLVLTLGILGLVFTFAGCGCCYFVPGSVVGVCLGIPAWIMGRSDLMAMRARLLDDRERGMTQAGYVMGIVSVCLGAAAILGWIGLIAFTAVQNSS